MLQRAFRFKPDCGGGMAHMWFLWLKNRWRGAGAAAVAVLTVIVVALLVLSQSGTSISFLGDASAARSPAAGGPSRVVLPRSGVPLVSGVDKALPPSVGPQTVAAAQTGWSVTEIAQHQDAVLAAVNCTRQQRGQSLLALDSALSATAGDAWLKLVRDPAWSLMQLPGTYSLRGVVSLDFASPKWVAAQSQHASAGQPSAASSCTVGGVDGSIFAASADAHTIGIAVFPPQASWDAASAVVLVR
jgi:hypothetical protein